MKNIQRGAVAAATAIGFVLLNAMMAFAQAVEVDPSAVVVTSGGTVWTELQESFSGIAPYGAGAIALFVGWRVIRKLVHA